jgi:hypothetical protein
VYVPPSVKKRLGKFVIWGPWTQGIGGLSVRKYRESLPFSILVAAFSKSLRAMSTSISSILSCADLMEAVSATMVSGRPRVKLALIRLRKASFPLTCLSDVGIKRDDGPPIAYKYIP